MSLGHRLVGGVRRHADAKVPWFDFIGTDFILFGLSKVYNVIRYASEVRN